MIPSPCFGCTKRCLGCRSECKGWAVYTALKERHDCIREQQRKESPYIEREHIKVKLTGQNKDLLPITSMLSYSV